MTASSSGGIVRQRRRRRKERVHDGGRESGERGDDVERETEHGRSYCGRYFADDPFFLPPMQRRD